MLPMCCRTHTTTLLSLNIAPQGQSWRRQKKSKSTLRSAATYNQAARMMATVTLTVRPTRNSNSNKDQQQQKLFHSLCKKGLSPWWTSTAGKKRRAPVKEQGTARSSCDLSASLQKHQQQMQQQQQRERQEARSRHYCAIAYFA